MDLYRYGGNPGTKTGTRTAKSEFNPANLLRSSNTNLKLSECQVQKL